MLAELNATLEKAAAEQDGILGVLPGLVAESSSGDGWIPAPELAREPYQALAGFVDETAERWNAPRHVAAAVFWKTYTYWHIFPIALGWSINRRVPLMRLEHTMVRPSDAGVTIAATEITVAVEPGDPVAGTPGTVVSDDLGATIREALLDGQQPLIEAISKLTRIGRRNLWGSTAEAFAGPLLETGPYQRAEDLLRSIGRPVDGLIEPHEDGYRRRTCCLWVTLPDEEACSTCCVKRVF
ncbi:(2Fe-2S)-binding protein [Acrocarpospora sp. B8E8]|uniref:(2Fe-2S)-binding protein n=1 Tax=Acrocarpospora sp. B8E8 TaxID=3153572 RepID=UPI00325D14ED